MFKPEAVTRNTNRTKTRNRATALLLDQLDRRLATYALAAGAAGVGLIAAAPARAEIIYTPTNIRFSNGTVFLDLNSDGLNDFSLTDRFTQGGTYQGGVFSQHDLVIGGAASAGVIASDKGATVLLPGAVIGSSRSFRKVHSPRVQMLNASYFFGSSGTVGFLSNGNWKNVSNGFLGLRFIINGQVHYGWARVNVHLKLLGFGAKINVTLLGYAYETTPNNSIQAGETAAVASNAAGPEAAKTYPGTLGALALGSNGLSIWRRKQPSAGHP